MHAPPGLRAPFVIRLKGRIPRPGYPENRRTLSEHLKSAKSQGRRGGGAGALGEEQGPTQ